MIETPLDAIVGQCLRVEHLVWVGAQGGEAFRRNPLPVSLVAESCAFRPAVLAALHGAGCDWRTVFENGHIDATIAMAHADLTVLAWLASTVPPNLAILPADAGLPEVPPFAVTLLLPSGDPRPAVAALADEIREAFVRTVHAT